MGKESVYTPKIELVLTGSVFAKQRARFARIAGFLKSYDPQSKEAEAIKKQFVGLLNAQGATIPACFDYAELFITFCVPRPKKHKVRDYWKSDKATNKPDLDNYVKFYLDCGNGILWPDDSLITKITAQKIYCDNPRVELNIEYMQNQLSEIALDILATIGQTPDEMAKHNALLKDVSSGHADPRHASAAFFSYLADIYSAKLAKIAKKYPNAWQKIKEESCAKT